jgi:hypothetical protein
MATARRTLYVIDVAESEDSGPWGVRGTITLEISTDLELDLELVADALLPSKWGTDVLPGATIGPASAVDYHRELITDAGGSFDPDPREEVNDDG